MNEEERLSALLRQAPVPSTTFTVSGAVRSARRSLRRRRLAMGAGAAAVAAVAMVGPALVQVGQNAVVTSTPSPSLAASPSPSLSRKASSPWVTEELPIPAGVTSVKAEVVDPTGRYLAGAGDDQRVVLWDNGSPMLLPPLHSPVHNVIVKSINSSGDIVGTAEDKQASVEKNYPWLYHHGQFVMLAPPRGEIRAYTIDINSRGDILGASVEGLPLLWHVSDPGKVTKLSGLDGAWGIADDGTVGGRASGSGRPVLRDPSGKLTYLDELPGRSGFKMSSFTGEWAAGHHRGQSSTLTAARLNVRTGELTQYPHYVGPIFRLNATGAFLTERIGQPRTVFVDPQGNYQELFPLTEADVAAMLANPRVQYFEAADLSDDGKLIVGTQTASADGRTDWIPVVWRLKR